MADVKESDKELSARTIKFMKCPLVKGCPLRLSCFHMLPCVLGSTWPGTLGRMMYPMQKGILVVNVFQGKDMLLFAGLFSSLAAADTWLQVQIKLHRNEVVVCPFNFWCQPFSMYPRTYDFLHVCIDSLIKDLASGKQRYGHWLLCTLAVFHPFHFQLVHVCHVVGMLSLERSSWCT